MLGQVVGNYSIIEVIGEGGMGSVYRATHRLIGRSAAIKLLREDLSHNPQIVTRFFNEAKAATAVKHPGIVEVFDFGTHEDRAYLVMELLEGETLRDRIEREDQIPEPRAIQITRQVLGALRAAHGAGIVHRDLKPDNIFLVCDPDVTGGERTKILDFGIAKLVDDRPGAFRTQTGQIMGTPAYMSPEQCKGLPEIDARSDLYSIGCIFYHMLCGRPPFVGRGAGEVLGAHMHLEPESVTARNPAVSRDSARIVAKLMAKEPADRYASAADVLAALERTGGEYDATAETAPPSWAPRGRPASAAEQRTTLSAASMVSLAPPTTVGRRSPWPLLVIGAGLAIAIGITIGVMGGGEQRAAQQIETSPKDAPLERSDDPAAETGEIPEPSDEQPPEPLGPPEVSVAISSQPSRAEVYLKVDNTRVGITPFQGEFAARDGGEHVFVLKLAGHVDQEVALSAESGGQRNVQLAKLDAAPIQAGRTGASKSASKTRAGKTSDSDKRRKTDKTRTKTTTTTTKKKRELDDDEINPFRP